MSPVSIGVHMIEWFGLEGTFKDHIIQPPCHGRDIFHWMRLLKSLSSLTWNILVVGASIASLGNLLPCLATFIIKELFLMSSVNLPSFNLKTVFLVLLLQ